MADEKDVSDCSTNRTTRHETHCRDSLKLDQRGLPLSPQPTDDLKDPLNWNRWLKLMVLAEVSALSFLALLSASLITPAFVPLSKALHRDLVPTAYVASVFILCVGVSPIFWNPIANVYGRRPVYLVSGALSVAVSAASGVAESYGSLVALRCLGGFFGGVPLGLGSVTVCDMFFAHQRGVYMGFYTISFLAGGHIAPLIGGYIAKDLSWRWCFYVPAIVTSAVLTVFALTAPETLYLRGPGAADDSQRSQGAEPAPTLHLIDFVRPFRMLIYPSVLLPTCCYALCFAYGSILFIITSAELFADVYHLHPQQIGLLVGVPITLGGVVGELFAGGLSDWVSERRALARRSDRKPEDRLLGIIPAAFLTPLGVIIEGVCLQRRTHWMGVAMGIAIASAGLQVATTGVYTYTAECYKSQAPGLGTIINFVRQVKGFTVGFYAIPLTNKIGIQNAWLALAMTNFASFLPLVPLYFRGASWRKRLRKEESDQPK